LVDDTQSVFAVHADTATDMFGVAPPNHASPSRTICHWKLYEFGVVGAVTFHVKVFKLPGVILSDRLRYTRSGPQVVLFKGLYELRA